MLAASIMAIALMLNVIIPPMQSPDEPAHLGRAYLLSQGQVVLDSAPQGAGGYVDDGLLRFMGIFLKVGVHGKMDFPLTESIVPSLHWEGTSSHAGFTGSAYYFPAIYIPQAIALIIGKALHLSIATTYQLVRLAVFATTTALILWSAALVRPGFLALGLVVMPMTLFQALSSTIDALSFAICMLSVSCFLVLCRPEQQPRHRFLFAVLCIGVFILTSSRAQALPMLLLPFVVAWLQKSRTKFMWSVIVVAAAMGWTLFALVTIHDDRVPRALTTGQILEYYGSHPGQLVHVLLDTMRAKWRFYIDSFIGNLGYLNVPLPRHFQTAAICLLAVLTACSVRLRNDQGAERIARGTLLLVAIPTYLLVFVAMLATWTPFPNPVIEGVQGRYFHIPALMVAYALWGTQISRSRWQTVTGWVALAIFAVASVTVTATALLHRYWLYEGSTGAIASRESPDKVPLVLKSGSILTGQAVSPGTGMLYSLGWDLGTYYGRANGTVTLEVCAAECRRGSLDIAGAEDNRIAYIVLDRPLPLTVGTSVRFQLTMSRGSTHPVAFWAYPGGGMTTDVALDGAHIDIGPAVSFGVR
jgi:uncharacterized membrane protein